MGVFWSDGLWTMGWVTAGATAVIAAVMTACVLLATRHWHLHWTQDHPDHGEHKLHAEPTMRIGGVVIVMGMLSGWCMLTAGGAIHEVGLGALRVAPLTMAAVLLIGLGLIEDVTRNVSVRIRLLAAAAAALLTWAWAGVRVTHTEVILFDQLIGQYAWLSLAFTVFAITGLVHAMNIIDGLNGLLAGTALLVFLCVGFVSASAQAWDLYGLSWVAGCATAGFALFNFPRARMFCGDSGAYLLGFVSAVLLVMLMQHHITSPWFGLALVIHPVTETLYSSWRRFRSGQSPTSPDTMHLHSLILTKMRPHVTCDQCANARASVLTLAMAAWPMLVCVLFPKDAFVLQTLIALYVVAYCALHTALVRHTVTSPTTMASVELESIGK